MKRFKVVSVLLIVILLFAACDPAAPAALTPAPSAAASVPSLTAAPSASVSGTQQPAPAGLYSGPYEDGYTLPQSIPVISEADRKTFNPQKVRDYLATDPGAEHEYYIKGAELKGGKLYLIIKDSMYYQMADDAYVYLRDAFSLSDEEILNLPEFKGCSFEEGIPGSRILWSDNGMFYLEDRILDSVPIAGDATIVLDELDVVDATVDDFIDAFLKENSKNDSIDTDIVMFDYSGEEITAIYSAGDIGADGDDEGDYEDEGDYGDEGDEGDYEDAGDYDIPPETHSPHEFGFGSLPYVLLGIEPVPAENYDPDKAADYLLANTSAFEDYYLINKAEYKNGKLYLYLTNSVSIDADIAYQYLKTTFSLTDDEILALPIFSESYCALYDGKMYTPDGWGLENGEEPEDSIAGYNYNSVYLKDITLPEPVPVAGDADIFLFSYGDYGGTFTTKEFADILQGFGEDDISNFLANLWFKYSNNEITAIAEQFAP